MELSKISSFKSFSEMRKQQDAIKTEQENKVQRVKSLEQISAILDELEISDMSTLDEEKKKALYAKLFSEDRAEEIEDEIVAKGKETDAADEVGDIVGKAVADEVEEDKAEEIEADIKDLGEPKEEDPKDGEELESELDEANVTLDAMEPTEKGLVDFCKKKGIKWKVINMNGPAGGWPEVEYIGKKKDLEEMIKKFWEGDGEDSGLAEFINEARSINKIQNDWSKITAEMAKHAAEWKAASAEDKPSHLEVLKGLTAKKKALEAELDDAVTGKDKDLELVVTEGNAFTGALFAARNKGEKTFEFNGKTYKVHSAKVNEEDKEITEGNAFGDAVRKAKEAGEKEFEFDGKTYKVEEGNAFGDAVRKAKEAGEKEFEFDGKTYKVEEALTEGSHGMATKLLQDLVKGDTSRAEGIKMSKELAQHFIDWIRTSPFGKKNGNLPLDMLIKASFNWGIERGLDSSLKSELADLKDSVKEALVFEGAVKQFEIDYKDMETSIKRGIGWIDPEYVEDTWENSSDAIDFELVKGEIYNRLLKAGLLWYSDEDGEEKDKQVKSLKELGIKESVNESTINESPSSEEIRIAMLAVSKQKKYRRVTTSTAVNDLMNSLEVIARDIKNGKIKDESVNESVVTEAKNDFVAKHSGTNINLKNGYKNHNEEELTKLYNKIGELLKDELSVKDVTVVFESKVNEAEIKSDDEFKEYAMTVLKKAFGADFDEAKAEEVADGILKKCDGDYGACVGMLTSSLGESVTNEAKEFSFIFNYNTDEDDVAYIQNILKKAGVNATAEAGLDSEEMEVKAANAIELRKAKKAIEADGFEINEASRRATDFYGDSKYGKSIDLLLKGKWDSKKVENFLDKLGDGNDVKYARIIDFISGDAGLNIRKYKNIGEQLPDLMKQLEVLYKDFLTESVNEAFNANYWEDYHEKSGKIENPNDKVIQQEVEASVEEWNDNNEDGEDNEVTSAGEKKVLKLAKEFVKAKGWISSDIIEAMIAQES